MSEKKHSGENRTGVTVQLRFVPLKKDEDEEEKNVTISVLVDDKQKGTPDNIRELELPMIRKLELEGETFVLNKIKLINTIFQPKGWIGKDTLKQRLEKYAMFITNRAKSDFMVCQRKARMEFIELYEFPPKDAAQVNVLTLQHDEFLKWLEETKTLKKLEYVDSVAAEEPVLEHAREEVFVDYENAIMFFCGQKLWEDHRNTFREHKKYFQNQITKPFGMAIVNFNDRMREYGDTLRYLQPPSRKGSKRSSDAQWDALLSITEEDTRTAMFDALPEEYRTHITGQFEEDFRSMDDIEFLEAMLSHETIDKARRAKRTSDKEKDKKPKDSAGKKPSYKKRIRGDDGDDAKPPSKYRDSSSRAGKTKKYCSHCKESDGKYWTHDTDQCFVKDKAAKAKKESNVIEAMQKELRDMKALYKKLKKSKKNKDDDSDSSDSSD